MGVLPQALQIIFEVQWKKINEKITRRKKKFQLPNTFCFFLPLLLDPPTLKPHIFLTSYSF